MVGRAVGAHSGGPAADAGALDQRRWDSLQARPVRVRVRMRNGARSSEGVRAIQAAT